MKNPSKKQKPITDQQRRALHLWFKMVADALNDAGMTMRETLKPEVWQDLDVKWSKDLVKEHLWRRMQMAIVGKASTKQLMSDEIDKIYEPLNKALGERLHIHKPFPSIEDLMFSKEYENFIKRNS